MFGLFVKININMRCIEITIYDPYDLECSLININMRCIEIIRPAISLSALL